MLREKRRREEQDVQTEKRKERIREQMRERVRRLREKKREERSCDKPEMIPHILKEVRLIPHLYSKVGWQNPVR